MSCGAESFTALARRCLARHILGVAQIVEFFFVAYEVLQRWLQHAASGRIGVWLGLTALLRCAPDHRVDTFVEPKSGRPYRVLSRLEHDRRGKASVLFSLHAHGTHPDVIVEGYSLIRHAVKERGMLLVVPEGRLDANGKFHWNAAKACCGAGPRHDDLGYLRNVLRDLAEHYQIDTRRVFALGLSNGAFMAHAWACAGGGELSGIIAIAGAAPGPDDPPCQSARPVSVLHVHGTADDVIPYAGKDDASGRYPSAAASVARWVAIDGGSDKSQTSSRFSLRLLEPVSVQTWQAPHARVGLWTFEDGDHYNRGARFFMPEYLDFVGAKGR